MPIEVADLIFVRLAHVENVEIVAPIEARLQILGRNFWNTGHGARCLLAANAAEISIVDQLRYGAMRPADGAIGILAQLELAELHGKRVEEQQASDKRRALADDQLQSFGGLNRADNSRQHAQNSPFGAGRNQSRRGRLRIQAAVARSPRVAEDGDLSFKAENRAVNIRLAEQHARVIH